MFKFIREFYRTDQSTFVGKLGEIICSDEGVPYLHDGATPGGSPFASASMSVGATADNSDGSRENATLLNYEYNWVNVSNDMDTVRLPPALAGRFVALITGRGANTLLIWPTEGDTLNGDDTICYYKDDPPLGGYVALFICETDGNWGTNCVLD